MRVLIVEDDETSAEMLEACVAHFGYRVAVAHNGNEAHELVRTGLYPIVISDWEMPEMSGVELCQSIRHRQTGSYIYFILLTSRSGTRSGFPGGVLG